MRNNVTKFLPTCLTLVCVVGGSSSLVARQNDVAPLRVNLKDAVRMALDQGYSAASARAVRAAAEYRDDAFYGRLFPQLSLSGNLPAYNRSIIEVIQPDGSTLFRPQNKTTAAINARVTQAIPMTGAELFVTSSLTRLSVSGTQNVLTWTSAPIRVGISQPIFQPNIMKWNQREQPLRTTVAEREYTEAREDIALATAGLFFDVYAAQVALQTATSNAAVNDTLYTLNSGRYQIGSIGQNDLLQSELALLQAQTALDAASLDLERSLAALRNALHISPDTPLDMVVPTEIPDFEADTALATSAALRNRSVIKGWELQSVQADRRAAVAKLQNRPGATLEASYGFNATGSDISNAYRELLDAQQLTLSVQIPLLQWGAGRAEARAASADVESTSQLQAAALVDVAHEARFAALQLSQARRGLLLSAQADTVGEARFEIAYNRYVIGRISIDNLFLAQREKDQAKEQYVRALRGYWDAYYQLRRTTLYDFEAQRHINSEPFDRP